MLSVERRDAKPNDHLRLDRGGEMGEAELEEGETLPYHNEGNYVSKMITHFDSNRIEQKIQDVLGHFQKDFEGIVSYENLGSVDYISFIKVNILMRFPGAKFGEYGSFLPTYQRSPMMPLPRNLGKGFDSVATKSFSNSNILGGNRFSVSSTNKGQSGKPDTVVSGGAVFRGSRNPSSFVEAGKSQAYMEVSSNPAPKGDSKRKITAESSEQKQLKLRIKMGPASLSTHENAAIYSGLGLDDSPSLDDSESEEMPNEPPECSYSPAHIVRIMTDFPAPGDSLMSPLADGLIKLVAKEGKLCRDNVSVSVFGKRDRQSVGGKPKNVNLQKRDISSVRNTTGGGMSDDPDLDSLNCEDLVTKTMMLPLFTTSSAANEVKNIESSPLSKDASGPSNVKLKAKKEETPIVKDECVVRKSKNANVDKRSAERVVNAANQVDDDIFSSIKDDEGTRKTDKPYSSKQSDYLKRTGEPKVSISGAGTIRIPATNESADGKKKKVGKKNRSSTEDGSTGDGKPLKVKVDNNQRVDTEYKDAALLYKDFFGESDIGIDECNTHAPAVSDNRKPKSVNLDHSEIIAKERSDVTFKTSEKTSSRVAPLVALEPGTEIAPPVPDNDNWVRCDKCQQWRLLPRDKNPEDLPDTWLCSMLDWLPSMNSCRFTQDETTKALNSLYHVPAVESQSYTPNAFASVSNLEVRKNNRQDDSCALPTGKKQVLAGNTTLLNGPLNEEVSLMAIAADSRGNRDDDFSLESNRKKGKEKYSTTESASDKDDGKRDKAKLKRSFENDAQKGSKKMRLYSSVDDRVSTPNGTSETRSKGIPHATTVNNMGKHNELSSSKDSSHDIKNEINDLEKGLKVQQINSCLDLSVDKKKMDGRDATKKRKVDRFEAKEFENAVMEKDDFSESKHKTVKKSKLAKPGGKEAHTDNLSGKADKGSYRKTVSVSEEFGSQRKNSVVAHPPLAATSSSSKVSGSHKSKINFYEAKGSPVESVSSSPLRTSRVNFEKDVARDEHDAKRDKLKSAKKENPREDRSSKELQGGKVASMADDSTYVGVEKQLNAKVTSLKKINDDVKNGKAVTEKGGARSKDRNKISTSDSENVKEKAIDSIVDRQRDGGKKVEGQHKIRFCTSDDAGKKDSSKSLKSSYKDEMCGTPLTIDAIGSRESTSSPRKEPANNCSTSTKYQDPKSDNERQLNSFDELKKASYCNGAQHSVVSNKTKDNGVSTSGKKDSSNQAALSVIKEAKLIKHTADRLQNDREFAESNKLYFEAALKFLHGSYLLESSTNENARNADSMEIYCSTAKLCEFCAHEYEKSKDMASAALAYKCVEVAYMRVVFHSHNGVNRDRQELQTALQMIPPGESPSSSASDVDNLNNILDKPPPPKTAALPQAGGSHVITTRMKPNFDRFLKFSEDVHLAMEASRKSRAAISAACSSQDPRLQECISLVKAAIDFNFQDVDALLRLVRIAFHSVTSSV